MNFDEFTGEIQHRLELPGTGETVRTIRETLMTLGQRIPEGNAENLAASLPLESKWYLTGAGGWGDAQEAQTGGGPQPVSDSGGNPDPDERSE